MTTAETGNGKGARGLPRRDVGLHPTTAILQDYLGNPVLRAGILRGNTATLDAARARIGRLESPLHLGFSRGLLGIIGTHTDAHVRRGALTLLEFAPVGGITPIDLRNTYLTTVGTVTDDGIGGLLRAGRVLAPHMVEDIPSVSEARTALARHWMRVPERTGEMDTDVWQTVALGVFDMQQVIHVWGAGKLSPADLKRTRSILEVWSPEMSRGDLGVALVASGAVKQTGKLPEDLKYLADMGITVPFANGTVSLRRTPTAAADTENL